MDDDTLMAEEPIHLLFRAPAALSRMANGQCAESEPLANGLKESLDTESDDECDDDEQTGDDD